LRVTFRERVLYLVRAIPSGRLMSYGEVAAWVGSPRAARQVGGVLFGLRDDEEDVPWQRVVNARGGISTFKVGVGELQVALLRAEGVVVADQRVELTEHRWAPTAAQLPWWSPGGPEGWPGGYDGAWHRRGLATPVRGAGDRRPTTGVLQGASAARGGDMKGNSITLNGDLWTIVDVAPAEPLAEMVAALLEEEGFVAVVRGTELLGDALAHLGVGSVGHALVLVPAADAEAALALIAETVTDYEGDDLEVALNLLADDPTALGAGTDDEDELEALDDLEEDVIDVDAGDRGGGY
jgi:methylated-DNA-protein-cysteine methyltransferase related protein